MAKDPAFLFYPNDYIGGTMGMSFEEKGAYMELLMMQFNRGHMTEHMIRHVIGHLWDNIKVKFEVDSDGLYFNKRLEEEQIARINYTKSRNNNRLGVNQHTKKEKKMVGHMTSHMENENEDIISIVKEYYKSELELISDSEPQKKLYYEFITYLLKNNDKGEPCEWVKLPNQVSFKNFQELIKLAGSFDVLKEKIDIAINKPAYLKGKKFVHLTLKNWIKR